VEKLPEEDEAESKQTWRFDYHSRILGVVFPAVFAVIFCVFCLIYRVFPGPEFVVLCFLIYAMYNKWSQRFVKDWAPFIACFLSYEAINGLVGGIPRVLHEEPINIELKLFGTFPTLVLQRFCRNPVLDYLGAFVYSLHFIAPVIFAFILWKYRRKDYWKYILAFAICTYSALVTFLIYPVAPPWYAVAGVTRILFQVDHNLGVPVYRTIFDSIQPNVFAAFPSLHSTYPWLISLFALKIWKKKALPVLLFPISVWFSAVYLGEHYVVDVMGGIAYATVAFLLAEKLIPQLLSRYAHGSS
jgi:membrane-associated phospholipid phosphatase